MCYVSVCSVKNKKRKENHDAESRPEIKHKLCLDYQKACATVGGHAFCFVVWRT